MGVSRGFDESLDICRNPWRIFEIIGKWPEQRIQAFKRLFQELLSEGIREDEVAELQSQIPGKPPECVCHFGAPQAD
jgi:hypothetical protein